MTRLERLKNQVLAFMMTDIAASIGMLEFQTGRPEWQVRYAVRSLCRDGVMTPTEKPDMWKLCERRAARTHAR